MAAERQIEQLRSEAPREDVDIHAGGFVIDPPAAVAELRERCPVARSNRHGGFWLLSRYEDVRAAAVDWRTYTSSVPGVTAIPVITPRTEPMLPIELDPPEHSRYRALVNPVFAAERVAAMAPSIDAFARDRLEAIGAKGGGELVAEFCVPVSITALAAFTNVPLSDSDRWIGWIASMFDISDPVRGAQASAELGHYIDALIAERRSRPTGDFISTLIAAEIGGQRLSDRQIHSFVTVVFGAGFETTSDALSTMLLWVAENPEQAVRLRANPALFPSAIEEFLRFFAPIQIFGRNASHDIGLHGRHIPAGDIVALGFGGANRDPAVFPDADRCVLDRKPNRHLTFGAGPHLCAGAAVARMEMAAALKALAQTGFSYALDPDRPPRWKPRGDRRGLASLHITSGAA